MRRAIVVVLDGCGAGAAPDAPAFGDGMDVATVKNVWDHVGGFSTPNLEACGFLAACGVGSMPGGARAGRLRELSQGKDSVTGHWEMMGAVTERPFPTYPDGFPAELVREFCERAGIEGVLGNRASSGTAIIEELGAKHVETGLPILYTSADSVFQVAAHEGVVPIERLYEICRAGREVCRAPHDVQRIIARPFEGEAGSFRRTERRKDFPLRAPANLVDEIGDVFGIGVVPELFDGRGFREVERTQSNREHERMMQVALESDAPFIFANFEDFDMLHGHRNDPVGFARCLEEFDHFLGWLTGVLREEDLLILTADHGNDPTDKSTDHSREFVPVALVGRRVVAGELGDVVGMSAVGRTVSEWLGVSWGIGQDLNA